MITQMQPQKGEIMQTEMQKQYERARDVRRRLWEPRTVAKEAAPVAEVQEEEIAPVGPPVKTYAPAGDMTRIGIAKILQRHRVSLTELISSDRGKRFTQARREVCAYLRYERGYSYGQIGDRINRDHSTAVHHLAVWSAVHGERWEEGLPL